MSATAESSSATTYQVTVSGVLGPAVRKTLPNVRAIDVSASTVFRLETSAAQEPVEIAALLRAKGLDVLSIRRLQTSSSDGSSATGDVTVAATIARPWPR